MNLIQIVDRRRNKYFKHVEDPKTGDVIRHVEEPLTHHKDRGSTMKAHTVSEWFGLAGDSLLFLSALLLLLDFAPRDLFPSQQARRKAVATLRTEHNLLGQLPTGVRAQAHTPTETLSNDPQAVSALVGLIRQHSDLSQTVDWSRVVGVGYGSMFIPVGQNKLDAFRSLYVTLLPKAGSTVFEIVPVGQLEDLERWLSRWHQSSLTLTAAMTLAVGFLLQLLSRVMRWRHNKA